MNQFGYARLTAATIVLFSILFPVLIYQFFVIYFQPKEKEYSKKNVLMPTSIQLFPQSLPVYDNIKYLLSVVDEQEKTYTLSAFFHKEESLLRDERGILIKDGFFSLPSQAGKIEYVLIHIFDDSVIDKPVFLQFLRGTVDNDRALLQFDEVDFSKSSGQFMLATPTDNNSLINERSGLWFGDVLHNTAKLQLPSLSPGWMYEGWVVVEGKTVTSGRFNKIDQADQFNGFSDTQALSPNFPGEDFLLNVPVAVFPNLSFPMDLAGQSVMITIEPDRQGIDPTGAGPFPTQILRADIPKLAASMTLYPLTLNLVFPKATAVLR